MEQVCAKEIRAGSRSYILTVSREDLSALYPGFSRYTVSLQGEGFAPVVFRTNSYEYEPGVQLRAEEVAMQKAGAWERDLREDPAGFLRRMPEPAAGRQRFRTTMPLLSRQAPVPAGTLACLRSGQKRLLRITV